MPGNRYKYTPREYFTAVLMPSAYGLDQDVSELEDAVAALQAAAGQTPQAMPDLTTIYTTAKG